MLAKNGNLAEALNTANSNTSFNKYAVIVYKYILYKYKNLLESTQRRVSLFE